MKGAIEPKNPVMITFFRRLAAAAKTSARDSEEIKVEDCELVYNGIRLSEFYGLTDKGNELILFRRADGFPIQVYSDVVDMDTISERAYRDLDEYTSPADSSRNPFKAFTTR